MDEFIDNLFTTAIYQDYKSPSNNKPKLKEIKYNNPDQDFDLNNFNFNQQRSPIEFNNSYGDSNSSRILQELEDLPTYTKNTSKNNIIQDVVDLARSYVGQKYVWGGKNPEKGFDCSGLISYVYKQNGIDIPATTAELFKIGKEVSLNNVQIGDIICTSGSGRSGRHVKMVSNIDEDGQIYTIEAKGEKYGIIESPLTKTNNIISIRRIDQNKTNYDISYSKAFDIASRDNPELLKHKAFLTKLRYYEGGPNSKPDTRNTAGAPHYGYFGFGHAALKQVSNYTMDQFIKDPVEQILAAGKLYDWHIKEAKRLGYYNKAKQMGYSDDAIVAGAWLGGAKNAKNYVLYGKDSSDSHYYKGKGGTSISKRMKLFN